MQLCKTDILQNTMDSKLLFLLLVLIFEDHFRFLMLFLNKFLNLNRINIFDLNTVIIEKAVKNQSKFSNNYSCIIVPAHCFMVTFSVI